MAELQNIDQTRKTPKVILDPSGIISFEGRSIPEDAGLFYENIINWLNTYAEGAAPVTTINIALEYLNSGTSKYILKVLKILKDLMKDGNHEVVVNWYFEEGDDDIVERGEYYASILDLKINYIKAV